MLLLLVAFLALMAAAVGLYALSVRQGGGRWWGLATLTVVFVLAGLANEGSWTGIALLSLAELAAGALILSDGGAPARAAGRLYLSAIVPAIVLTMLAFTLVGIHGAEPGGITAKIAICLLLVGFALKLGLIPFSFWVPAVARGAPTTTAIVIISIVDIATFGELASLRHEAAWLFDDAQAVWVTLALVSMFAGALLAYAQTDLKRMLAFSTITDLGLLVLGVSLGTPLAMAGALLGALSHALSKTVLFGTVGLAERHIGMPVTLETRGLGGRMPLASAAFILAAINFIGVPPGFGFSAYWRIYVAATDFGGVAIIAVLLVVAAIDLLCYARAIHRCWLGTPQVELISALPRLAPAVLAALVVLTVALGFYPRPVTSVLEARPAGEAVHVTSNALPSASEQGERLAALH
ncbi:proton-conducting transporter membrane subunit [Breoghania sp. JC706]|uniref:proton-conducting transporter transmembrane domain-containing protein n=1 Tax=Breoghania sp. JC706 TaxID=3117732 RepID=UPI00300B65DA